MKVFLFAINNAFDPLDQMVPDLAKQLLLACIVLLLLVWLMYPKKHTYNTYKKPVKKRVVIPAAEDEDVQEVELVVANDEKDAVKVVVAEKGADGKMKVVEEYYNGRPTPKVSITQVNAGDSSDKKPYATIIREPTMDRKMNQSMMMNTNEYPRNYVTGGNGMNIPSDMMRVEDSGIKIVSKGAADDMAKYRGDSLSGHMYHAQTSLAPWSYVEPSETHHINLDRNPLNLKENPMLSVLDHIGAVSSERGGRTQTFDSRGEPQLPDFKDYSVSTFQVPAEAFERHRINNGPGPVNACQTSY